VASCSGWRIGSALAVSGVVVVVVGAGRRNLHRNGLEVVAIHRVFGRSVGDRGSIRLACRSMASRPFLCVFWRQWDCCPETCLSAYLLVDHEGNKGI